MDSERIVLEVAGSLLAIADHTVPLAASGEEALAHLAESTFDATVMDLEMPRTNGLETTQQFRQLTGGEAVVVLSLSGHARPEIRDDLANAGFAGFLLKPATEEQIEAAIAKLIAAREGSKK